MSEMEDGGPAFPVAEDHQTADALAVPLQISLRDWFAGQIMSGIMQNRGFGVHPTDAARGAYMRADAMLAARAAKET